jgi:hypothetical protein
MVAPPVGYQRPPFPSLYWPLGPLAEEFNAAFLYSFEDIWYFTTAWTMVLMTGLYTGAAILFLLTHYFGMYRHPSYNFKTNQDNSHMNNENIELHNMNYNHIYQRTISTYQHYFVNVFSTGSIKIKIITTCMYIIVGAFQGLFIGSIIGVLIAAVYVAAQFKATTWVPFIYALIAVLYNIANAYQFTVRQL